MKKLFIGAAMMLSFVGFSQSKYFSFSAGYGLGFPGERSFEVDLDTNGEGTYSYKNRNMGGGVNATLSYGMQIGENLALDLALVYQNNLTSVITDQDYWPYGGKTTVSQSYSNSSFRFAPSLRFEAGKRNSVKPFVKVGPQIMMISSTYTYERKSDYDSFLSEEKYGLSFSVGALTSLGVEVEIAHNLMLFSSLDASLGYFSPSKSEIVTYEIRGEDRLDELSVYQKETLYVKERAIVNEQPEENKPRKNLKNKTDYSSIGLNVGVRFLL